MTDNYMVVNGARYPVINAWVEVESPSDGRRRWGIVTEGEEQPAAPADATAPDASCKKCGRTFVDDGKFVDSAAQSGDMPFCKTCVDRCHDTEIADHWCMVDQYRTDKERKRVQPIGRPFPGFPAENEAARRPEHDQGPFHS